MYVSSLSTLRGQRTGRPCILFSTPPRAWHPVGISYIFAGIREGGRIPQHSTARPSPAQL